MLCGSRSGSVLDFAASLNYLEAKERRDIFLMLKSELVERVVVKRPHLSRGDVERVVDAMLDKIAAAMSQRDRVEMRGFGTFATRKRRARIGRNPRSGTSIAVGERFIPFFKAGKEMRARLNRDANSD
jgi:integration host factor subunit beta